MNFIENPKVLEILRNYPKGIQEKLATLRQLIITTASENEDINTLEETLKWGEPSYITKTGSTIRINRKKSSQDEFAIYFICSTGLVDTFRVIYRDTFTFEGNRAIVFNIHNEIPIAQLKHCISLALTYHRVKHLPLLGA
ncbi:DUF1801 domain-containing protein [Aquimarina mytili]|uniref:DUF1801 domain-containing protein n=1 Tax=Aquimarina mytili TaxID=874423 RepID=A0A937D7K5_9FLAO|nr:DUF1801 domain-containing protein [Aquimarina mytili]MBL0685629.1 DUF1801 domain-containing protein [Aquimarina mytili]